MTDVSPYVSRRLSAMAFISMCFVVYIHVRTFNIVEGSVYCRLVDLIKGAVGGGAVPFFFAASGFFIAGRVNEAGWYATAVLKRFRSLMIPFFLVSLLTYTIIFFEQWLSKELFHTCGPLPMSVQGWLVALGLDLRVYPYALTLWFLRSLFVYVLLSGLFMLVFRTGKLVSSLFLLALCLVAMLWNVADGVFKYTIGIGGMFCFAFGMYIRLFFPISQCRQLNSKIQILSFLGAIVVVVSYYILPKWLTLPRVVLLICFIWCAIPDFELPNVLKRNIFPVYLFHALILHFVYDAARHSAVLQALVDNSIGFLMVGVFAITLSIVVAEVIRRKFNRFSTWLYGGR